jgi:tRNA (guanine37-N1)-methyltransferase
MLCSILTLFPGAIRPYLDESILGIAQRNGKLQVRLVNFRDYSTDRHKSVDDRPFGGGPGMVLMPGPIIDAIEDIERTEGPHHKVLLCPRGRRFTQEKARDLSGKERLLLLCGRYEGYDERIRHGREWDEVSLGDFVLSGGELAALAVLEASVRLIPGVLGCSESAVSESFSDERMDHPQYTRPRVYRGLEVPEVLLSGDHGAIAEWRAERARELTEQCQRKQGERQCGERNHDEPGPGPRGAAGHQDTNGRRD